MSLKTYVVAIALKINHFRNKEGYIFHDIVTTQINIDASFRTLWIRFHHPYMWQHFDVPRIQQATLTFITDAATESEVQHPHFQVLKVFCIRINDITLLSQLYIHQLTHAQR